MELDEESDAFRRTEGVQLLVNENYLIYLFDCFWSNIFFIPALLHHSWCYCFCSWWWRGFLFFFTLLDPILMYEKNKSRVKNFIMILLKRNFLSTLKNPPNSTFVLQEEGEVFNIFVQKYIFCSHTSLNKLCSFSFWLLCCSVLCSPFQLECILCTRGKEVSSIHQCMYKHERMIILNIYLWKIATNYSSLALFWHLHRIFNLNKNGNGKKCLIIKSIVQK